MLCSRMDYICEEERTKRKRGVREGMRWGNEKITEKIKEMEAGIPVIQVKIRVERGKERKNKGKKEKRKP